MAISRPRARLVLWAALMVTLPLPYYLGGFEVAPALRLCLLAALVAGIVLTEGLSGMQGALVGLAVGLALLYTGVLFGASGLLARLLARRGTGVPAVPVALVVVALLALSLLPLYQTSMSSVGPVSNLFGIFD